MNLLMLFGNEVIDLINIKKTNVTPTYLLDLKQELITRNEENLNTATDEPQFALGNISDDVKAKADYVFI